MVRNKKGQSTVEYILLVTAVVAALIIFLRPNGPFGNMLNRNLNAVSEEVDDMTDRLTDSHPATESGNAL